MNNNIPTNNKRTASDISNDIDSLSHQPERPRGLDTAPSISTNNDVFSHYIQQSFLGPICTSCKCKVARGNLLFNISRNSIKSHIATNNCYSGNLASFKSQSLERSLRSEISHLHHTMRDNPAVAGSIVKKKFKFQLSSKNLPYCNLCGFIGSKLCHIRRHVQSISNICTESDIRTADGTIMINEYGFLIPRSVLDRITAGQFILPICTYDISNSQPITPHSPKARRIRNTAISQTLPASTPTILSPPHTTTMITPPRYLNITNQISIAQCTPTATLRSTHIPPLQACSIDVLPPSHHPNTTVTPLSATIMTNPPNITPVLPAATAINNRLQHLPTASTTTHSTHSLSTPNVTHHIRFLPSYEDFMMDIHNNSGFDASSLSAFISAELLDTFGNKEKADQASEYLTFFILLINQQTPGLLKRQLLEQTTMLKENQLDFNVMLLIKAGKRWFKSNAANLDVRMVPVHHRNGLYLVGNSILETDRDLLKGNTFVWSDNVDPIIGQFESLITFAHAMKWPQLAPFLEKVYETYVIALEDTNDEEEDDVERAIRLMLNTTIICGLLTEILLEDPPTPNGANLIYQYLAVATVRQNHNKDLVIRNPNEISKHANALLRLLRHGVCSIYVRESQRMARNNESHKNFEVWANKLIQDIQVCPSIGHICRTIRTSREVDRKTPSTVQKAFNDKTGELFVSGHQIHKSTWSVAIPTAMAEWDKYLYVLFPQHSRGSTLPLDVLFDLDNSLVLAGNESYISLYPNPHQTIPLNNFQPVLSR